jgi:hypothetical protein
MESDIPTESDIPICQAITELDEARDSASLIVQDVPNPPNLLWVECNSKDAVVVWEPRGDNRAPILTYKIQYNTSFIPDTWETATGKFNHTLQGLINPALYSLKLLIVCSLLRIGFPTKLVSFRLFHMKYTQNLFQN